MILLFMILLISQNVNTFEINTLIMKYNRLTYDYFMFLFYPEMETKKLIHWLNHIFVLKTMDLD